jgi:sensor histidine kinase YesM
MSATPLLSLMLFDGVRDAVFISERPNSLPPPKYQQGNPPESVHPPREVFTHRIPYDLMFYRMLFITILAPIVYVFNVVVLIPNLLAKRRIEWYLGSILLTISLSFLLHLVFTEVFFRGEYFRSLPPELQSFEQNDMHFRIMTVILCFMFALSTSIEITTEWIRQSNRQKEIENEKLTAELSFLKSQINPHFLFNTLNNIYSLAADKSDDTETAILKLSQLMRYALYESDTDKIALKKEIEHIENYIELQKLRLSAKKNINITFTQESIQENQEIAPMLLIPFVENAFKHGISYVGATDIRFLLVIEGNYLLFSAFNNKINKVSNQDSEKKEEEGGIGLTNVIRRLDLLYPEKYKLKINDLKNTYEVEIKIEL